MLTYRIYDKIKYCREVKYMDKELANT
ncbi:abortive phage infection protein, partial [Bacillus cereus]